MEFVKEWALGLVVAAIVGAVVLMLTPNSTIEKQVRTAVSLFLLIAFIYPFLSDIDISDIIDQTEMSYDVKKNSNITEIISSEMENQLKNKIEAVLSSVGIKAKEIKIDVSVNQANEMQVDNVKIIIDSDDDDYGMKIKNKLRDSLGLVAEVEVK